MKIGRTFADDEVDRETVLYYLRSRVGQACEEAEISLATHVPKMHVRRLLQGVPGIDEAQLAAGNLCWNPSRDSNDSTREANAFTIRLSPYP
jgi:hypothetical protein